MKKNKHITRLAQEKMRLRIQQLEQEKAIGKLWGELKEDLRPGTFIRSKLKEAGTKTTSKEPLFPHLLQYSIGYISRNFSKKAEDKIETALQKGVEKIKNVFKKK